MKGRKGRKIGKGKEWGGEGMIRKRKIKYCLEKSREWK